MNKLKQTHNHTNKKNNRKTHKKTHKKNKNGGSLSSDMVNKLTGVEHDPNAQVLPSNVLSTLTADFMPNGGVQNGGGKSRTFSKQLISNIFKNINGGKKSNKIVSDIKKTWNKFNKSKSKSKKNTISNKHSQIIYDDLKRVNTKINMNGGGFLPEHWFTTEQKKIVDVPLVNISVSDCPTTRTIPPKYMQHIDYTNHDASCKNTLAVDGIDTNEGKLANVLSGGANAKIIEGFDTNDTRFMEWNQDTNLTGYRDSGDSALGGSKIPETLIQTIQGHMDGTKPILPPSDSDVGVPNDSGMFCTGNSCAPTTIGSVQHMKGGRKHNKKTLKQ